MSWGRHSSLWAPFSSTTYETWCASRPAADAFRTTYLKQEEQRGKRDGGGEIEEESPFQSQVWRQLWHLFHLCPTRKSLTPAAPVHKPKHNLLPSTDLNATLLCSTKTDRNNPALPRPHVRCCLNRHTTHQRSSSCLSVVTCPEPQGRS